MVLCIRRIRSMTMTLSPTFLDSQIRWVVVVVFNNLLSMLVFLEFCNAPLVLRFWLYYPNNQETQYKILEVTCWRLAWTSSLELHVGHGWGWCALRRKQCLMGAVCTWTSVGLSIGDLVMHCFRQSGGVRSSLKLPGELFWLWALELWCRRASKNQALESDFGLGFKSLLHHWLHDTSLGGLPSLCLRSLFCRTGCGNCSHKIVRRVTGGGPREAPAGSCAGPGRSQLPVS